MTCMYNLLCPLPLGSHTYEKPRPFWKGELWIYGQINNNSFPRSYAIRTHWLPNPSPKPCAATYSSTSSEYRSEANTATTPHSPLCKKHPWFQTTRPLLTKRNSHQHQSRPHDENHTSQPVPIPEPTPQEHPTNSSSPKTSPKTFSAAQITRWSTNQRKLRT